jgi:hypothetical protein
MAGHISAEVTDAFPSSEVTQREVNELVVSRLIPRPEASGA